LHTSQELVAKTRKTKESLEDYTCSFLKRPEKIPLFVQFKVGLHKEEISIWIIS